MYILQPATVSAPLYEAPMARQLFGAVVSVKVMVLKLLDPKIMFQADPL
jgi:hypothetical protein